MFVSDWSQILVHLNYKKNSNHLLIMEVDFYPVLCVPEVPVLQAFRGNSHFVWKGSGVEWHKSFM